MHAHVVDIAKGSIASAIQRNHRVMYNEWEQGYVSLYVFLSLYSSC